MRSRYSVRRRFVLGAAVAAALAVPASVAWACVGIVAFTTTGPPTVQPGGTIEVFGGEFARGRPVHIRLDSPTGPILATHENPLPSTMTSRFTIDVPIPADTRPGQHVLVATQDHFDMNAGIPARAVIYVGSSPPVNTGPEAQRPVGVVTDSGPDTGGLVLVGLLAAGAGLLVAGLWSAFASRRSGPEPEGARAG